MKKTLMSIILILIGLFAFSQEPESLGLPGDGLNLYGVLNIFQKSSTLEQFERNINNPDTRVNNLDLNGDGQIDYIQVVDHVVGQSHLIVLQVAINENNKQDIAVIEVGRTDGQTRIQIIGDEDLYGKDYIVEPPQTNPGYDDGMGSVSASSIVDTWSIINFLYTPTYVVYNSPYYWGYYPYYWHPWTPLHYNVYYNYHRPYYNYYRRGYYYRSPIIHNAYTPHRNTYYHPVNHPMNHPEYHNNYHPQQEYHPQHMQQNNNYHPQPQHMQQNNNYHPQPQQHSQPQQQPQQHSQPPRHK